MVCRDAYTNKAKEVNPLVIETEEEGKLYALGERKYNLLSKTKLELMKCRYEGKAPISRPSFPCSRSANFGRG